MDELSEELSLANIEIRKLKNKLFLKDNNDLDNKSNYREYKTNQSLENITDVNNYNGTKTPIKTSKDKKNSAQNNSHLYNYDDSVLINKDFTSYGKVYNKDFYQKNNFNKERNNNYDNTTNTAIYNFKPIGKLKNESMFNNLDEGILEYYKLSKN